MKRETFSPTVEMLLKARGLIEENWCKGPSHGPAVCAVEALWKIAKGSSFAVDWLQKALPAPWVSVIPYNDHPDTTKADILALYDRAIDLALEDE
jgi:hypothetical protein